MKNLTPDNHTIDLSRLPKFLRRRLNSCPVRPKRGVHPWLYHVARHLYWHFSEEQIFRLLRDRTQNCGRVVSDNEITGQIRAAEAERVATQRHREVL
jgi:hypothetical protein